MHIMAVTGTAREENQKQRNIVSYIFLGFFARFRRFEQRLVNISFTVARNMPKCILQFTILHIYQLPVTKYCNHSAKQVRYVLCMYLTDFPFHILQMTLPLFMEFSALEQTFNTILKHSIDRHMLNRKVDTLSYCVVCDLILKLSKCIKCMKCPQHDFGLSAVRNTTCFHSISYS